MKGIIGKKVGMTQVFDEKGNVVPVTVIQAGPTAGSGIDRVFDVLGAFSVTFNNVTIRHGQVPTGGVQFDPSLAEEE